MNFILELLMLLFGAFSNTSEIPQTKSLTTDAPQVMPIDSLNYDILTDTYLSLMTSDKEVQPTFQTLRLFIYTSSEIPAIKKEYKGDYDAYVKLFKKNIGRDDNLYLGNEKQMRFFSDDYELLKRRVIAIDSIPPWSKASKLWLPVLIFR